MMKYVKKTFIFEGGRKGALLVRERRKDQRCYQLKSSLSLRRGLEIYVHDSTF